MDAVVAVYADWGLGRDGMQPLVLSADRRQFRTLTAGSCVIVGRKTLADFPGGRPLPGRMNLVLSRQALEVPGGQVVRTPEAAVRAAAAYPRVFVIGGAAVYRAMLPWCSRVYVTKIDARPDSDVFLENLDQSADWVCVQEGPVAWERGISYRFCVYARKSNPHTD